MKNVIVYSTSTCIYCRMVKDWLKDNNVAFTEVDLAMNAVKRDEIIEKTGQMGVPVIEVDGKFIVGFDRKALSEALGL